MDVFRHTSGDDVPEQFERHDEVGFRPCRHFDDETCYDVGREYAAEWIPSYTGRTAHGLRESTRREYRLSLERRAIPFLGRLRLSEIEPQTVKRFVSEIAASGVSRNTTRLALAPVRALLATAVEEGLLRTNPALQIRIPAAPGAHKEEQSKALSEAQLARVVAEAAPTSRLLISLLADTGLRVGEAVALQWGDIRFEERRLAVRRRYYRGSLGPPKSASGAGTYHFRNRLRRRYGRRGRDPARTTSSSRRAAALRLPPPPHFGR
jgi:integrase